MLIHHKTWLCILLGAITLKFEAAQLSPKGATGVKHFLALLNSIELEDQIQEIDKEDNQIQETNKGIAEAIQKAYQSHGKYAADLVQRSMESVKAKYKTAAAFSYTLLPLKDNSRYTVAYLYIHYPKKVPVGKACTNEFYSVLQCALVPPNEGCQLVQHGSEETNGTVTLMILRNLYLNRNYLESEAPYPFQIRAPAAKVTSQFVHFDGSQVNLQPRAPRDDRSGVWVPSRTLCSYGAFLARDCKITQIAAVAPIVADNQVAEICMDLVGL